MQFVPFFFFLPEKVDQRPLLTYRQFKEGSLRFLFHFRKDLNSLNKDTLLKELKRPFYLLFNHV